MVSPYPPARDGIAAYAVQAVAGLRAAGHDVEVLSPGPSAAHHHLDLAGPRGALALARRARHYDRVVIQFHPDVFFPVPCSGGERAAIASALTVAFRAARDLEVRVHEMDYSLGRGSSPAAVALRMMWRAVPRVVVHTEAERASFHEAFGVPLARVALADHGADFMPHTTADRETARASFGIGPDELTFLSIGFIQPHKGFDRAIRAFAANGLGHRGCRLDVVGSVRLEEPGFLAHLSDLERLADSTPGVRLHTGYISDEAFDRWIVAADLLVLPYRHIWSSGVLERAALYERPVIVTRVGGLEAQAAGHGGATVVDTDADLADAMRVAADEALGTAAAERDDDWPFDPARVDRDAVMTEVRARAAASRGGVPPARDTGAADGRQARDAREASVPLRRLGPLSVPAPVSGRPGASILKSVVRRLTAWEVDPIVHQVNRLQQAVIEATERLGNLPKE
ncbi:MAG: glycosyltransferase [Acidimicrobiales bacterium]|nr:glycosyltransferase [Acidimicrobiales bacterium]